MGIEKCVVCRKNLTLEEADSHYNYEKVFYCDKCRGERVDFKELKENVTSVEDILAVLKDYHCDNFSVEPDGKMYILVYDQYFIEGTTLAELRETLDKLRGEK